MDFNLTEEQSAFRDVVRRWVDAELPKDLMRKLEADEENYPYEIWDKLKEQGFFGIGIPEEYGGLGGDVVLQMIFAPAGYLYYSVKPFLCLRFRNVNLPLN